MHQTKFVYGYLKVHIILPAVAVVVYVVVDEPVADELVDAFVAVDELVAVDEPDVAERAVLKIELNQ